MRPEFILGFKTLADMIPDVVGEPLEDEHHNPENGDGLQRTTKGLMVWRKADNWTAFTDGYRTWVNGPFGLQTRLNTERFDWEQDRPAPYQPAVLKAPTPNVLSRFYAPPQGVILHGSRSGISRSISAEADSTARYAATGANGLAWTATIGEDAVVIHTPYNRWGWNARRASMLYLAVEFAQPTVDDPITDGQVRAFCWLFQQMRQVWPELPAYFPTHAELDGTIEYGGIRDGKTDVFPPGDRRTEELRRRIGERLAETGVV